MGKAIKIISERQQRRSLFTQPSCWINSAAVRSLRKINQNRVKVPIVRAPIEWQPPAREQQRGFQQTAKVKALTVVAAKTIFYYPRKPINCNRPTQIFTRNRLERRQSKLKSCSRLRWRALDQHNRQCLKCLNATRKSSRFFRSLSRTRTTLLTSPSQMGMESPLGRTQSHSVVLCRWTPPPRISPVKYRRWHVHKLHRMWQMKRVKRVQFNLSFPQLLVVFTYVSVLLFFPRSKLSFLPTLFFFASQLYWFVSLFVFCHSRSQFCSTLSFECDGFIRDIYILPPNWTNDASHVFKWYIEIKL